MNELLEQRVALLEKNIRFYRYCFGMAFILVIVLGMMSFKNKKSTAPDLIQAKSFQVVDDNDQVLVEINNEDGNGQLSTFTPQGKRLISLFTTNSGAGGLNTFDAQGNVLVKMTNTDEGGGYLALFNKQKTEVAELGVSEQESGYLRINDHRGDKLAWITNTQAGGGYLSLFNNGNETIRMSTPAPGGRLGIYNAGGSRVAYIGAQENKDGNMTVWNNAGNSVGSLPQQKQ